jgi:hypothetical protein
MRIDQLGVQIHQAQRLFQHADSTVVLSASLSMSRVGYKSDCSVSLWNRSWRNMEVIDQSGNHARFKTFDV